MLARIRDSGADLVFMGARSETGGPTLIRQMAQAGLVAPGVRFLGPGQLLVDTVLEEATCDAALATDMRLTFSGLPVAKLKDIGLKMHRSYIERFREERSVYDLFAVETGRVAIDGIRRASDDLGRAQTVLEKREVVRKAIAATRNFDGQYGKWSFDRNGDVDYDSDELDGIISGFKVVKGDSLIGCAFEFDALLVR